MVKILKKINILMDGRQKRQMVGLFCMMAVSAFLETGGCHDGHGSGRDGHKS